jgi:hypothetical protein
MVDRLGSKLSTSASMTVVFAWPATMARTGGADRSGGEDGRGRRVGQRLEPVVTVDDHHLDFGSS